MPNGFQVFLSHSEADRQLVERIWAILTRMKVEAYMHELYPDYRQDIPSGIRDVLRDCIMCVTFLTKNGINSQWVQQELGIAFAFKRVIVPVIETGVDYKGFVQMVRRISYTSPEIGVPWLALPGNTENTNDMIQGIIFAVRHHVIQQFDQINGGLGLVCANNHEYDYALPSNKAINDCIKANKVFIQVCPTCQREIRFNPRTLETLPPDPTLNLPKLPW